MNSAENRNKIKLKNCKRMKAENVETKRKDKSQIE